METSSTPGLQNQIEKRKIPFIAIDSERWGRITGKCYLPQLEGRNRKDLPPPRYSLIWALKEWGGLLGIAGGRHIPDTAKHVCKDLIALSTHEYAYL